MTDNENGPAIPITDSHADSQEKVNPRCVAAVNALREIANEARQAFDDGEDDQGILYQKGCICVGARTAYAALLDHLIWQTEEEDPTDRQLLEIGKDSEEFELTYAALKYAFDTIEAVASREDPYLDSVREKLDKFS